MSYLTEINELITGTDKQSERLKSIVEGICEVDGKSAQTGIRNVLKPFNIDDFNKMDILYKKLVIDSWQA